MASTPSALVHLKPWKPGQSGNPLGAGHPNYKLVREATKRAWNQKLTPELRKVFGKKFNIPEGITTIGEVAALALVARVAKSGDPAAFVAARDTIDGKPPAVTADPDQQLGFDEQNEAIECLRLAVAKGLITLSELKATEGKRAATRDPRDYVVDTTLADDEDPGMSDVR